MASSRYVVLVDETEDALSREGARPWLTRPWNLMPPARGGVGGGGGRRRPRPCRVGLPWKSVAEEALRSAEAAAAPDRRWCAPWGPKSVVLRGETWVDTAYAEAAAMSAEKSWR